MPVYAFACPNGHVVTKVMKSDVRPMALPCEVCEQSAAYQLCAPGMVHGGGVTLVKQARSRKAPRLALHDFLCGNCGCQFDEVVDREEGRAQDGMTCIECGDKARWLPSAKIDRFSESFPYYDRGLGLMLTSKAHRRQVCKDRGLTPVDGDWQLEDHVGERWREEDQLHEDYLEYSERLDKDPAFAQFRKAEARERADE